MSLISCACGCGGEIEEFDERGRKRRFVHGHSSRGKSCSEKTKQKISDALLGKPGKPCSEKTKQKISDANTKEKIINVCRYCGNKYIPKQRGKKAKEQQYCSRECSFLSRTGIKRKPFTKNHIKNLSISLKGKHCSPQTEFKRGSIPHNKGKRDKTDLQQSIRTSIKMIDWRKEIFKRDNYICRDCGIHGSELNAHHIQGIAFLILEYNIKSLDDAEKCVSFWDINNGITLCLKCHNKTKKYNQYKNEMIIDGT